MDEPSQQGWRANLHFVSLQNPESGGGGVGVECHLSMFLAGSSVGEEE